jgi:mannose-1-phosphate guanylyltransferase/mannose-6-phosphate isomerase
LGLGDDALHAVILAGGSGTRFWPLSREQMPKQLLNILGEQSMFALTLDRIQDLVPNDRIWVVTTRAQAGAIRRELRMLDLMDAKVLEEPTGRNTAAAIGLAAINAIREDPQAILSVFPADHHIENIRLFLELLQQSCKVAASGWLVTLGIRPSRPETGYGYIHKGEPMKGEEAGSPNVEVFRVKRFTEKPDLDTAKAYLKARQFFWNSGMFVWRADRYMEETQKHLPEHYRALLEIKEAGHPPRNRPRIDEIYGSLAAISVDYGILERSDRVAMIPADMGWSDVGSWASLREILEKDEQGNVLQGDVLSLDTQDSFVRSDDRLVATLGVERLVVVDTADALLVCPEDRSQEVRKIAERLREQGRDEAQLPRAILKPWGAFRVLDRQDGYQVKWLDVRAGERLSLQSHKYRSEHWIIVSGIATVTLDDQIVEISPGSHIHIPRDSRHRVENRGKETLRLIEVQTGEYLGEDDIVRYEDDYGRIEKS